MKKLEYSWIDVENMCIDIVSQMYKDKWTPDYIVGITRGGNVPATIISNMLGIRCEALKVSLRDDDSECEHNWWMAEDAFGIIPEDEIPVFKSRWDVDRRKNILIVDDINDTGSTIKWIKDDWKQACFPDEDWDKIFGANVKFATLTDNLSSCQTVEYSSDEVNKAEEDVWLVYPWESVGKLSVK